MYLLQQEDAHLPLNLRFSVVRHVANTSHGYSKDVTCFGAYCWYIPPGMLFNKSNDSRLLLFLKNISVTDLSQLSLCRIVLAEQLSLKTQAQVVSESDILIMNHGAAMGNIIFMAPVGNLASLLSDLPCTRWTMLTVKRTLPFCHVLPVHKPGCFPQGCRFGHAQAIYSIHAKV